MGYTELHDDYGHLLARYDLVRRLLEIKRHRQVHLFDLDSGQRIGSRALAAHEPGSRSPPVSGNEDRPER